MEECRIQEKGYNITTKTTTTTTTTTSKTILNSFDDKRFYAYNIICHPYSRNYINLKEIKQKLILHQRSS